MMRATAVLIFATVLPGHGAAADPSLAAPGDCAQPSRELVTEPVFPLPAGVAGPVSNHFAPVGAVNDARGLLPLDLTRVSVDTRAGVAVQPAGLVAGAVDTVTNTMTGVLGGSGGGDFSGAATGGVQQTLDQTLQQTVDQTLQQTVNQFPVRGSLP